MASILVPYGLWLPPVLVLSTLPAFGVVLAYNWKNHQWWKRTTPDLRWTQYYDWLLTMTPGAAEIRLFGLGGHVMSAYQVIRQRLRDERLSLLKSQSFARLFAGASALLISGLVMGWMVWLAFQRRVTLGDLVLFYQAFSRGQGLMQSLLGSLGQVYSNSLFLGNLFEFLDLKPTILEPADPANVPVRLKKGISFRNVRFCYPGNTRATLENFNLEISAGKIVAIVGLNGAGKSTLVKLLCRFYNPQAGRIELDGIDIGSFSLRELRRMISVLFQTPMHYHATAGQNITLGDISASPHDSEIEAAARGAGAHEVISALPHGYSALLGRWFVNGNELSSGQWQRIALARAFFRKAEIIILDEPTSSMDPWAETDWLERFRTLARGRTGIIITHRFTVAMRADLIHVMREGEIIESGSHDDLIARGGLYSQSWSAQMQGIPSSTT
jgi:ATP-binding cassette subfamily B protein